MQFSRESDNQRRRIHSDYFSLRSLREFSITHDREKRSPVGRRSATIPVSKQDMIVLIPVGDRLADPDG